MNKNALRQRRQRWKDWPDHWDTKQVTILGIIQLILAFLILGMEIGNSIVDLYRANVYSGFWSFPFLLAAVIATFASVWMLKTPPKAMVAAVLQVIGIFVLLVSTGFLIAYMSTNFTFCLGSQCSQNGTSFVSESNTAAYRYSAETYALLKRIFIGFEFALTILFIISSVTFVFWFMKSTTLLAEIYPIKLPVDKLNQSTNGDDASGNKFMSASNFSFITSEKTGRTSTVISTTLTNYYRAEKVCPECGHASPYIPDKSIVECPKCHYKSPFVEHGQQS